MAVRPAPSRNVNGTVDVSSTTTTSDHTFERNDDDDDERSCVGVVFSKKAVEVFLKN